MSQPIHKTIQINAPASKVWDALTTPALMPRWMMPDSPIEISTNWQVGSPFTIRGNLHGINFENRGTVLQFEREKTLQYSHLSSSSHLPDVPASYSILTFALSPAENQTALTLTVDNFPTEIIYKHLAFYWNSTLEILRQVIEKEG